MKELLLEIINEAKTGQVTIDNELWPICFNTLLKENNQYHSYITNEHFPVLLIDNLDEFLSLLEKYLHLEITLNRRQPIIITDKERNLQKFLITYLFVNSTTEELLNPCLMLQRKISFLENQLLTNFNQQVPLDNIPDSHLQISSNLDSIFMETPHKLTICITNGNASYYLPSISYGIADDTCYIYSILNPKQEHNNPYQKKIKRLLYKINESVPKEEMNVSPSAVLSLSIFLKILDTYHVKKIKAVPYLPLRYLSRELIAKDNQQLHERNDFIQTNATNKFINTFLRLNYHKMIDIMSYPYDSDDYLNAIINNSNPRNNEFLKEINKKITK